VLTRAELQRLRALRLKKHREALGRFVVEGEKVVGELLAAGYPFEAVYATAAWPGPGAGAARSRVNIVRLTEVEMARASHYPTPSVVLAVGRIERRPLVAGELSHGLTLALDGIQDPGNVGTLLRLADWFALDRVVLSADCADQFHPKTIDASRGSFARVRVHTAELGEILAELAATAPGVPILGGDLTGDDVHTLPALREAVVIIGSEGRGLSPEVRRVLTRRVTIPRHGAAESLNAAVAAGIICAQLRRAK